MKYKLMIKKNILRLLFCLTFALFFSARSAVAAEMFFVSSNPKPAVGELFKADLFIKTAEESVNAMAGKITFSSDSLELSEVRDGNSIVNFWMDRPALKDGAIAFSGITPGGYHGEKGLLFSLIFSVKKTGSASIKISEGQALLNDGQGTAAKLSTPELVVQTAAKSTGQQINYDVVDKTPPESFVPEIAQDKNIAENKWFVVFATQDKESGIDHYEVQETKKKNPGEDWQVAVSPYVLQDQSLRSYVYVKAFDKSGNSVVAVVSPKKSVFSYAKLLIYAILALVIFFVVIKPRLYRRRA